MGANTAVSVAAAKPKIGGGIYYAPLGTVVDVDPSVALPVGCVALGPISKDGVQPSQDTSIEKVQEWDGTTLASLLDDESRSFEIKFYGVYDKDVQTWLHGADNVIDLSGGGFKVLDKGGKPEQCVLILEMKFGSKPMRKVIPVADPTITGEEPYQGSALMGYTVTVEALKDDDGVRVYEAFAPAPDTSESSSASSASSAA